MGRGVGAVVVKVGKVASPGSVAVVGVWPSIAPLEPDSAAVIAETVVAKRVNDIQCQIRRKSSNEWNARTSNNWGTAATDHTAI